VPTDDVPYEKILEFKARYAPELLALRSHLDDIYLSITTNRDIPRAKNREIEKLESALVDIRQSLSGFGLQYRLECSGVEVCLDDMARIGMTAAAAASVGGVGTHIALALAVGSLLKFAPKLTISTPIKRAGPLKYVYRVMKERRNETLPVASSPTGRT
jgi:hypothetical protein